MSVTLPIDFKDKRYTALLSHSTKATDFVINTSSGTSISLVFGTNKTFCIANVNIRPAPMSNCGIFEIGQIWAPYLLDEHKSVWLHFIEAYARSQKRSVLIGNDGVYGSGGSRANTWNFIKNFGKGYKTLELGWNRNYDTLDQHHVGLFYKDIGACHYPDIYGLGEFKDGAAHYSRS